MIRVVRLGSPRASGEGIRIGTVRRPPRGVPKEEFASRDFYDVWFPNLAPSKELVSKALTAQKAESAKDWKAFERGYRKEMKAPEAAHSLDLLAALSQDSDLAVGCYCEDEDWCHRTILRELLREHGADVT